MRPSWKVWRLLGGWGRSGLVFAFAFAALALLLHPPAAVGDPARDFREALDCVQLDRCRLQGAPTSLPGFVQGAFWIHVISWIHLLGGAAREVRLCVVGAEAIAVALLAAVARRWLPPRIALPGAILFVAALRLVNHEEYLTNPGIGALPLVLCAGGLLLCALTSERRFALIAAFALSLAIDSHVAASVWIPALVAVIVLSAPTPALDLPLALAVLVGTSAATSWTALTSNLNTIASQPAGIVGVVATAVVALGGAALRSRFRAARGAVRVATVAALLALPHGLGLLWLTALRHRPFASHYAYPALPWLSLVAAWLLVALARAVPWRIPRAGLPAVAALAWLAVTGSWTAPEQGALWSFSDVARLAMRLDEEGVSFAHLSRRVQGPSCHALVGALGMFLPRREPTPGSPSQQILVVKAGDVDLPTGTPPGRMLALEGGGSAVIRRLDSWLDLDDLEVCHTPLVDGGATRCAPSPRNDGERDQRPLTSFFDRALPRVDPLDTPGAYRATYSFAVVPGDGGSRVVELAGLWDAGACDWSIEGVDGLAYTGRLPGRAVTLTGQPGVRGRLRVARRFRVPECPASFDLDHYPPCLLETRPDEEGLRQLVRHGG